MSTNETTGEAQSEKARALQQEQAELRHIINHGLDFEAEVTVMRRPGGFLGRLRPRRAVREKRAYHIDEPTLATLDRLSALWVDMAIDETRLGQGDYLSTAKRLAGQEARKLARVVAVAVLGERLYTLPGHREDTRELDRLTAEFFHALKPSELLNLGIAITTLSNLGDFINSIRLMSATRTTDPETNLIEE